MCITTPSSILWKDLKIQVRFLFKTHDIVYIIYTLYNLYAITYYTQLSCLQSTCVKLVNSKLYCYNFDDVVNYLLVQVTYNSYANIAYYMYVFLNECFPF